ncbi:hypothetical protein SBP28_001234 [Candidozyma auris]
MSAEASGSSLEIPMAIDSLFMLFCTYLLSCMVLGMSIFYAGLIQRRSSFTILSIPIFLSAAIFIDWFIWGYSLCYSSASNRFIGNLGFAVLRQLRDPDQRIYATPRGDILSVMHFLFNGLLKIVCTVITFPGCTAERGRIIPMILFVFCWSVIVYNPVTYWYWNQNGWLSTQLDKLPVMDFAGGTCIHVVSGFTALAYSYILGPRNPKIVSEYRSSSNSFMVIGMCILLMGWCGFISGCDYKLSATTFYIVVNTWLSACSAGIVWTLIDYYTSAIPLEEPEYEGIELRELDHDGSCTQSNDPTTTSLRKISMVSFTSGVVCGLVVFTPAGGYISSHTSFWKSIVFGVIGGFIGNYSTRLKYYMEIDDALDIFAVHGVCGIVGTLLVGIFADKSFESSGGWVVGNWIQITYQILGCVVTAVYSFVMSLVLLYIIDMIPGLHLRTDKLFNTRMRRRKQNGGVSEEGEIEEIAEDLGLERAELLGSDWYELNGEYSFDYMEFIKVVDPKEYAEFINAETVSPEESEFSQYDTSDLQLRKRGAFFDRQ